MQLLLWRLKSLRTTIEVDQFFPFCYLQSQFGRDFEMENTETVLRDFIRKHTRGFDSERPRSWATMTFKEVETFQSYDAPMFREYLAQKRKTIDEVTLKEGTPPVESSQTSLETTATASGLSPMPSRSTSSTIPNARSSISPRTSDTLRKTPSMNSNSSKFKFKLKNVFTMGKKKEGSGLARSGSTASTMCRKTKALLNKQSPDGQSQTRR
jgi:hypothetical protein